MGFTSRRVGLGTGIDGDLVCGGGCWSLGGLQSCLWVGFGYCGVR